MIALVICVRVLYADADAQFANKIASTLTKQGCAVDVAPDGPACFGYAEFDVYDVIVLDFSLGLPMLSALRNSKNATPVLFIGGGRSVEEAVRALEQMAPKQQAPFALFGQRLDSAERAPMRKALLAGRALPVREDEQYACDIYRVEDAVPGASELAACYGTEKDGRSWPLGFIKIDYPAPDAAYAQRIRAMVEQRFGPPTASEGENSLLWNLGTVIVATQYAPELKQMALMYVVPRVYYLTRQDRGEEK